MFQSFLRSNNNSDKQQQEEEPEETITRKVRIVVTSGRQNGAQRGDEGGNMAHNDNQEWGSRSESNGLFSLFGTSSSKPEPVDQPEDIVALEEADDGSVEAGLEELRGRYYDAQEPLSKYDNVEVQPKPRARLLSLFSSKKLVEKEDIVSVEQASDDGIEDLAEDVRKKYDINALRVPFRDRTLEGTNDYG